MLAHAAYLDAQAREAPGYLFKALSQMIGGRIAEPMSHTKVTLECLVQLWRDHNSASFRQPVTGHLLRQLVRDRTQDYAIILRLVLARTRSIPALNSYIRDWLHGHFWQRACCSPTTWSQGGFASAGSVVRAGPQPATSRR